MDPAYDSKEIRSCLRRRVKANMPINRRNMLKLDGRPYRLDRRL